MIGPQHEQPQSESGPGFFDAVSVDFCDGQHGLFGFVCITRLPGRKRASALGLLFEGEELVGMQSAEAQGVLDSWAHAEVDGSSTTTEAPLERWRAAFSHDDVGFELELSAASPPLDLSEVHAGVVPHATGVNRYAQICELRGMAQARGRSFSISCMGRRQHSWGAYDWGRLERWRSLYGASESGAGVTVVSAGPTGSPGHGDEQHAAYLVTPDEEPYRFEEVRISTVFASDRLPRSAGLELLMPGAEYPRRVSGEAVCGTKVALGEEASHSVSFFRWSVDGEPAFGTYEIVDRG